MKKKGGLGEVRLCFHWLSLQKTCKNFIYKGRKRRKDGPSTSDNGQKERMCLPHLCILQWHFHPQHRPFLQWDYVCVMWLVGWQVRLIKTNPVYMLQRWLPRSWRHHLPCQTWASRENKTAICASGVPPGPRVLVCSHMNIWFPEEATSVLYGRTGRRKAPLLLSVNKNSQIIF